MRKFILEWQKQKNCPEAGQFLATTIKTYQPINSQRFMTKPMFANLGP
jgi:hypothetical protein